MRNRSLLVLTVLTTLGACAVGPDYEEPQTQVSGQFEQAHTTLYSSQDSVEPLSHLFSDPVLEQLVRDALEANHDLRIARANLAEARAIYRVSRFDLAPTLSASGGYTEQKLSRDAAQGQPRESELYDAGFDALWELDLFGGVRRGIEANRARAASAAATLTDAQVSITAEVLRTYFELRGQQLQLHVVRRNVDNQAETLQLTSARFDAGRGSELDVSRARSQLSASRAGIAPLEAASARSMHRLSVLTGRPPEALTERLTPTQALPDLPSLVAVGDPAALLRRRPDVRAAERELAAATADVGVSVADLFPHVTFVGNLGFSADKASGLGDNGSNTYLAAPAISWAALDLGRVRAQIGASRARSDAALANYEKTVLRALEETENSLVDHAASRERWAQIVDATEASRRAAELARLRFEHGVSDFLQVLDAERTLLEVEDAYARSRTEAATSLVAVYKALGGGWDEPR